MLMLLLLDITVSVSAVDLCEIFEAIELIEHTLTVIETCTNSSTQHDKKSKKKEE